MHYFFIDTCIWLSIAKSRNQEALIAALEHLIKDRSVIILAPELIKQEFEQNKDRVINSTRQRLSQEFKTIKKVVEEFGGENKSEVLLGLSDIDARLPLLSEVTDLMANRLTSILDAGMNLEISENIKIKAVERAIRKKAPFHRAKNSVADAVLMETFASFIEKNKNTEDHFYFITENHSDFSSVDHRKPHEDFSSIFSNDRVYYFLSLEKTIKSIDEELLIDYQNEFNWVDDETRGLTEILDSMEEFIDKIWFNRHMNLRCRIEKGEVKIVPTGTKEYGNNVIHEDVLKTAKVAAAKMKKRYKDTGPWDDFDWGMLNGKLSALRWVLGDEWDMLDT